MRGETARLLCFALALAGPALVSAQAPKLVTVAGRQVEVVEMGQGSPTLVLESGGGEAAAYWSGILPELAKHTRVIAYSRAGFGRSAPTAIPGSPQRIVSELHALLETLGETRPVIIAGHSWGGLLARLYVSTFPGDVVGLVLIDGTHEAQNAGWEAMNPASSLRISCAPPSQRLRPSHETSMSSP